MSKFKIFLTFFALYLAAGFAGLYWGRIPVWIFCTGLFAFPAILTTGVFRLSFSFFMPVIHRGKPDGNLLLLTFDDGPDPVNTPEILRTLEKYNIQAVFFCIGIRMQENPELVESIVQKGHEIGNHSMYHNWKFTFAGTDQVEKELKMAEHVIKKISGKGTRLFRPPYGVSNPNIATAVNRLNYQTLGWSLRSLDTVSGPEKMKRRVLKNLGPGKVILLHDHLENTAKMLPEIIEGCISKGYRFGDAEAVLGI